MLRFEEFDQLWADICGELIKHVEDFQVKNGNILLTSINSFCIEMSRLELLTETGSFIDPPVLSCSGKVKIKVKKIKVKNNEHKNVLILFVLEEKQTGRDKECVISKYDKYVY